MPSLRELQSAFADAVFQPQDTSTLAPIAPYIQDRGFSAAQRLQIYRNNLYASLTGALQAVYPVIARLVGAEFFTHAARAYIRRHPSTAANLHEYGHAFADFFADFPGAADLPYLPDTARLEWAYHTVFHAADHAPLALDALARVPAEQYPRLRFQLHPACRLLASDYPVLKIWQVNQPDYAGDPTVDLAVGGVHLLVIRRGLTLYLEPLSPGEYAFLQACAQGRTFAHASKQALHAEAALDLGTCLRRQVSGEAIVDVGL